MQKESTDIETNHNRELEVKDDVDNSKQEKQEEVLPVPVTKNAPQYTLHIDKSDYKLVVLEQGKIINTYDIAVGKNPGQKQRPGDLTTPTGEFTVDEVLDASYWTHDFQDGKGEIAGAYGPWFISLETGWDGIGIHGTHDPASIKTMVSEGCIRMHNADLEELLPKVVEGTKVIIEE
ncbi:MAG TPA: L,D-transpeptidase [Candidatus Avacidaminococcus intestinavium]|uniref:L,D-transpeptidase n=1 Tax=Candidatus Avacidaminococcus intestinavium TaxID=2840684 RepID=A0A9D1SLD5_9FIRM|nr:L,D-transpeptidase [Candidatus Avacidaminococcus intestinavium]